MINYKWQWGNICSIQNPNYVKDPETRVLLSNIPLNHSEMEFYIDQICLNSD